MPENNEFHNRYEVYDRMSTESLNAILELEARLDCDGELDSDTIAYIAGVIAKREEQAQTQSLPDVQAAWQAFQKNYLSNPGIGASLYNFDEDDAEFAADLLLGTTPDGKRIDLCSALEQQTSVPPKKRRRPIAVFSRVAAIFAAVLLVGTVTAYVLGGVAFRQAVGHWFQDVFFFHEEGTSGTGDPSTKPVIVGPYSSLQDALDAYEVTVPLAPTWLPDGYVLNEIVVDEAEGGLSFYASYNNADGNEIAINISEILIQGKMRVYEKNNAEVTVTVVQGVEHYIMENTNGLCAAWNNGMYECMITGNLSRAELGKMINSIYKG